MDCQALSFEENVLRGNMRLIDAYARRVNWAFKRLQQNAYPAKVTQSDLGDRVGKRVKRTFTQTAVAGWLTKSLPRELETQEALAAELDVDPSWLYFNRGVVPVGYVPEPVKSERKRDPKETPAGGVTKRKAQSGS